jgi:hypothetical protein
MELNAANSEVDCIHWKCRLLRQGKTRLVLRTQWHPEPPFDAAEKELHAMEEVSKKFAYVATQHPK